MKEPVTPLPPCRTGVPAPPFQTLGMLPGHLNNKPRGKTLTLCVSVRSAMTLSGRLTEVTSLREGSPPGLCPRGTSHLPRAGAPWAAAPPGSPHFQVGAKATKRCTPGQSEKAPSPAAVTPPSGGRGQGPGSEPVPTPGSASLRLVTMQPADAALTQTGPSGSLINYIITYETCHRTARPEGRCRAAVTHAVFSELRAARRPRSPPPGSGLAGRAAAAWWPPSSAAGAAATISKGLWGGHLPQPPQPPGVLHVHCPHPTEETGPERPRSLSCPSKAGNGAG